MEARKDQYEAYVKSVTPVHSTWKNVLMAGISGGLICLAAQISTNCLVQTGMEEKTAALWTMLGRSPNCTERCRMSSIDEGRLRNA